MISRLGDVIYWAGCALAILFMAGAGQPFEIAPACVNPLSIYPCS